MSTDPNGEAVEYEVDWACDPCDKVTTHEIIGGYDWMGFHGRRVCTECDTSTECSGDELHDMAVGL